jgi:hypothetical protein
MRHRRYAAALGLLFCSLLALAKDKKKAPLPEDVLRAHTVLVIVDPTAGVDAQDPNANRLARTDVEQALMKWGRFTTVQEGFTADLIIMVRKGNGKIVQPTIGGTPVNGTPPVSIGSTSTPDESTTHAAGRWGHSGIGGDPSNAGTQPATPQPQVEAGQTQDTFVVYRDDLKDVPIADWSPLDAPAVWRYTAKNALESPSVPAVEAFRKAIAESEKLLASNP